VHVVSDRAPGRRAQQAMMSGIVPGHSPSDCAGNTPHRAGRSWRGDSHSDDEGH
jgi:hypothetical protein